MTDLVGFTDVIDSGLEETTLSTMLFVSVLLSTLKVMLIGNEPVLLGVP